MQEENDVKKKVALTVGAVILAFVLLMVLVYQIIAISVENGKKSELDKEIATYKRMIAEGKDEYAERSKEWWIIKRARELGYYFDGDKYYKIEK